MTVIETLTSQDGNIRARIIIDPDAASPRKYAAVAYALTIDNRHGRFEDVDEDGGPLAEAWERISWRPDAVAIFERYARTFHGATTLYDYDAYGPVAIWYLLPEQAEEYNIKRPDQQLAFERQQYRRWAHGEVYIVAVEKAVLWTPVAPLDNRTMIVWEQVTSLGGIIGYDLARWDAEEAVAGNLDWAAA